MKEGSKLILVAMLAIFFVLSLFSDAFHLPESPLYLILTLLAGGIGLLLVCPLLDFLTVKCNFITFLLMGTIILTGVLYLMNLVMVDFTVNEFLFQGAKFGSIQISELNIISLVSIAIASFFSSFLVGVYKELDRK